MPAKAKPNKALANLSRKMHKCEICSKALPLGPNPVFQVSDTATILIAGQAPGVRVHESSIPFNDPSGGRLRQWMGIGKDIFYDPAQIAIVPMGFCYPGTGKSGDRPPRPECAATWHPELIPLLKGIKLTLTIGAYAQKYYLANQQQKTLTDTVKNWQQYQPNIIPLPHPSPRNNIWLKKNPWFELELVPTLSKRVKQLLDLS